MNLTSIRRRMALFPGALHHLLAGMSSQDVHWRPSQGAWSIIEIVNHLADEEVEDFRHRLRSTLEDPSRIWPPIDPQGAVRERGYQERDFEESLGRLARERVDSIEWLRSLGDAPWDNTYDHPVMGPVRAGDLLASWAAHDALHLRQVSRRLFELAGRDAEGFATRYAGVWPEPA